MTEGKMSDIAHELWAAAQLAPGEGIQDGVARLESILASQPAEQDDGLAVAYMLGRHDGRKDQPDEQPRDEPTVRYCPECSYLGEVHSDCRDCCPDGSAARYIPEHIAKAAKRDFHSSLASQPNAATDAQVVPTSQQISDYLAGLDAIQREIVEREARAFAHPAPSQAVGSEPEQTVGDGVLSEKAFDEAYFGNPVIGDRGEDLRIVEPVTMTTAKDSTSETRNILNDEVQLALGYSRNYAEASPYLSISGKEHILGLCDLVERLHTVVCSHETVLQHAIRSAEASDDEPDWYHQAVTSVSTPRPAVATAGDGVTEETRKLAEEGLWYFERGGDAGDRKYVEAIRACMASPSAPRVEVPIEQAGEAVAEVVGREPYLDGTPNPMHGIKWNHDLCPSCEDSLPIGTKLYTQPAAKMDVRPVAWQFKDGEGRWLPGLEGKEGIAIADGREIRHLCITPSLNKSANPVIPDGYVLVPVEPTDAMYEAAAAQVKANTVIVEAGPARGATLVRDPVAHIWKAMLAAAPEVSS